jgi:hypothetical protein
LTVIVSSFFQEVKTPIVRSNLREPVSPELTYEDVSTTVVNFVGTAEGAVNDYYAVRAGLTNTAAVPYIVLVAVTFKLVGVHAPTLSILTVKSADPASAPHVSVTPAPELTHLEIAVEPTI